MFANIKNRFISVIHTDMPQLPSPADHLMQRSGGSGGNRRQYVQQRAQQQYMLDKFAYSRPHFLQLLTTDELRASADHNVRPIIVPRDISLLPWGTGYAECVNSGKSEWNEDQAAFSRQILSDPTHKHPDLPYTYFGIFDGHAGYGAALAASHQFHHILHEKLVDCIDLLLPREEVVPPKSINGFPHPSYFQRRINKSKLIIGALESAFFHMDAIIAQDRDRYRDAGGCTACVALFIHGKLYVANAGDSRAVLCRRRSPTALKEKLQEILNPPSSSDDEAATLAVDAPSVSNDAATDSNNAATGVYPVPLSFDHTPETERQRLFNVARLKPHLMGKHYVAMEYARRPHAKDLGQRILCRQGTMKGWTYKTLTREDLRMPVVAGEGKRSRLLCTLGVTRGFGDHDLLAINTGIQIKPFLTPHPDVNHRNLSLFVSIPGENHKDGDYGILVMATDGLWDVSENKAVARTVFQTLDKFPTEKHRYTMVAQELVARARGKVNDSGHWRLADSKAAATVDDISVIVIPVYQYYKEHVEWEQKCAREHQERLEKEAQQATEAKENEATTFLNGIPNAQLEIEMDEDDDEIVVDLNRQTVQAVVEVEPVALRSDDAEQSQQDASVEEEQQNIAVKQDEDNVIDAQLNSALEAIEISATEKNDDGEIPHSASEKINKQRHRNRKDKH